MLREYILHYNRRETDGGEENVPVQNYPFVSEEHRSSGEGERGGAGADSRPVFGTGTERVSGGAPPVGAAKSIAGKTVGRNQEDDRRCAGTGAGRRREGKNGGRIPGGVLPLLPGHGRDCRTNHHP